MTEIMKQEGFPEKDLYVNSGYLFNSRVPFREKKRPLRILSAGTYQLFSWPKLPTLRPRGRVDWQIIYIAAGKGHFILDGKEVIVPAGSMILYQPKQVQDYFYFGKDKTQVWFVHFTGREVRNIFSHYEIPTDGYILHTGISKEYEDLFRRMRDELVNCSWGYEEMLTFLFRQLLMTMRRRMTENAPRVSGFIQDEMDRARTYFEEHYNEDFSMDLAHEVYPEHPDPQRADASGDHGLFHQRYRGAHRLRQSYVFQPPLSEGKRAFALQIPQDLPRTVHGGGRCEGRDAVIMTA